MADIHLAKTLYGVLFDSLVFVCRLYWLVAFVIFAAWKQIGVSWLCKIS
uniref:Predicted protein n=1 Tax=Hordeum vulgare subsp. vulgare TaxID=112509 RepID=F2DIA7_HORVV|nr:predicted protein [Hordeum vulgare subsp. vulgare]